MLDPILKGPLQSKIFITNFERPQNTSTKYPYILRKKAVDLFKKNFKIDKKLLGPFY